MPKKLKFTHADGSVSKRLTDRIYTHVVVGRVDLVKMRASTIEHSQAQAGDSWDSHHRMAKIPVGAKKWPDAPWLMTQADVDTNAAFAAAHPDRDVYLAQRQQAALDALAKRYGTGDKSQELLLQWSQSKENAHKGAQAHKYNVDVAVHPVDPA